MQDRIERILTRYNNAQPEKERFRRLYDNVYRFFMPDKYDDLKEYKNEYGENTRVQIYSNLGEQATDACVQTLQSMIAPVNMDWIDFEAGYMFGDGEQNQAGKEEANRRLGTLAELLNLYKANSNFDVAFTGSLYDLVAGQMVLLITEGTKENPIVFTPIPFREITIVRSKMGNAEAFYRRIEYKNKEIKRVWSDAKFEYQRDDAEKTVKLLECTEFNYDTGRWDYLIINESDNKSVIVEREFKTSPFVEMPWTITAGETYGRGPGLKAIADFMTLNKLKEYALRSMAFLVPFFLVNKQENYKKWIIRPGAMLPVTENPRENPAMQQMGIAQQADLTQFNIESLEVSIKKTMFNTTVYENKEYTALEYSDRKSELVKQVMNSYGRMVSMNRQVICRMIEVLQYQGKFPLEVDVEMFNGFGARIKMNTVLANGQKLESVRDKLNGISMFKQLDPTGQTLARHIKLDVIIPKLSLDMGFEADDIRNVEELAAYDEDMARRMQAARDAEIQEKVAVENAISDGKERAKSMNSTRTS